MKGGKRKKKGLKKGFSECLGLTQPHSYLDNPTTL